MFRLTFLPLLRRIQTRLFISGHARMVSMTVRQSVNARTLGKRFAEIARERDLPEQEIRVRDTRDRRSYPSRRRTWICRSESTRRPLPQTLPTRHTNPTPRRQASVRSTRGHPPARPARAGHRLIKLPQPPRCSSIRQDILLSIEGDSWSRFPISRMHARRSVMR